MATTAAILDPAAVRGDFPALDQRVAGHPLAYLDNAATTQKPAMVLDALARFYAVDNANVHRGIHELSRRATEAYEGARARLAQWIGARDAAEVIWTRGTTEAINLVAASWGGSRLSPGDEILITEMEHHSNIVPWQLAAQAAGASLRYLDINDDGSLRLDQLPELLSERTRIVALAHISNVLGVTNPLARVAAEAHARGAVVVVDGAQGAPHAPVDVAELGCDFYALSGHKMYGPTGIGALWGRRELLEEMPPYQGGGEMIHFVERQRSTWAALPHKFEAGTPNIAGAVGLAAAIDYMEKLGHDAIARRERELMTHAIDRLSAVPGLRIVGPEDPRRRSGALTFTLDGVHPHDIATILDSRGVAIRAGHHCAQLLMKRFGTPATARASFAFYNTFEEVDRLVEALEIARRIFRTA